MLTVRFNLPVNTSTLVVGKTAIIDCDNDRNAQANLSWSGDRKQVMISTIKTAGELFGSFNSFFKLTLIGTDISNGAIRADSGTLLDGDADGKAGGNHEVVFVSRIT